MTKLQKLTLWLVAMFAGDALAQPVVPVAPASQAEVNAGTVRNKFVSPATLSGWSGGGGGGGSNVTVSVTTNFGFYRASVSANGTNTPVVSVFANSFGKPVTWQYVSQGVYDLFCTNCFPTATNLYVNLGSWDTGTAITHPRYMWWYLDADSIQVQALEWNGTAPVDGFGHTSVEVSAYPVGGVTNSATLSYTVTGGGGSGTSTAALTNNDTRAIAFQNQVTAGTNANKAYDFGKITVATNYGGTGASMAVPHDFRLFDATGDAGNWIWMTTNHAGSGSYAPMLAIHGGSSIVLNPGQGGFLQIGNSGSSHAQEVRFQYADTGAAGFGDSIKVDWAVKNTNSQIGYVGIMGKASGINGTNWLDFYDQMPTWNAIGTPGFSANGHRVFRAGVGGITFDVPIYGDANGLTNIPPANFAAGTIPSTTRIAANAMTNGLPLVNTGVDRVWSNRFSVATIDGPITVTGGHINVSAGALTNATGLWNGGATNTGYGLSVGSTHSTFFAAGSGISSFDNVSGINTFASRPGTRIGWIAAASSPAGVAAATYFVDQTVGGTNTGNIEVHTNLFVMGTTTSTNGITTVSGGITNLSSAPDHSVGGLFLNMTTNVTGTNTPLQFATSTNSYPSDSALTNGPTAGAIWYGGTTSNSHTFFGNLYKVPRSFVMARGVQLADITVTNTSTPTTNTTIYSTPMAADYLTPGKRIELKLTGVGWQNNNAGSFTTFHVWINDTNLLLTIPGRNGAAITAGPWKVEVDLTCRSIGTNATMAAFGELDQSTASGATPVAALDALGTDASFDSTKKNWVTVTVSNTVNTSVSVKLRQARTLCVDSVPKLPGEL